MRFNAIAPGPIETKVPCLVTSFYVVSHVCQCVWVVFVFVFVFVVVFFTIFFYNILSTNKAFCSWYCHCLIFVCFLSFF